MGGMGGAGGDFSGIDFSKLGGGAGMPDMTGADGPMEEDDDDDDDDMPALEGEEGEKKEEAKEPVKEAEKETAKA